MGAVEEPSAASAAAGSGRANVGTPRGSVRAASGERCLGGCYKEAPRKTRVLGENSPAPGTGGCGSTGGRRAGRVVAPGARVAGRAGRERAATAPATDGVPGSRPPRGGPPTESSRDAVGAGRNRPPVTADTPFGRHVHHRRRRRRRRSRHRRRRQLQLFTTTVRRHSPEPERKNDRCILPFLTALTVHDEVSIIVATTDILYSTFFRFFFSSGARNSKRK